MAKPEKLLNRADFNAMVDLQKKVDQFKAKSPFAPPRAMVLNDNPSPNEPAIFLRGNPNNRGAKVPRRMPEIVSGAAAEALRQRQRPARTRRGDREQ